MNKVFSTSLLIALALLVVLTTGSSAAGNPPPHYAVTTLTLSDGAVVEKAVISGPPHPPPGVDRVPAPAARGEAAAASKQLPVPAYDWSFGCSATSAAMITAYHDRNGFPNIYVGPANGGVMPADNSAWGRWTDGNGDSYGQCPLTASRQGLDGRSGRGSIDDYWVAYGSGADDPYVANKWTQHTYGDAVGDYMKTSQSAYENIDGATVFYNWSSSSSPFTCADMVSYGTTKDGTLGRKQFYEARGYTVTDCYNQKVNNSGGFTFALYKAEIDAGRPVMINLEGHTVVGVGYDDSGSTVYIHDTWDYKTYSMTWGGSYAGMPMQSVSIVKLACPTPSAVSSLAISKLSSTQVALTWSAVSGADHYELWSAANTPYFSPGANCASPAPYACQAVAGTSLETAALGDPSTNYAYAARALNACGGISSALSGRVGEFEFALTHP